LSTVIGVFRDVTSAENAVRALRDKGFGDNEISIIAKDDQKEEQITKIWRPVMILPPTPWQTVLPGVARWVESRPSGRYGRASHSRYWPDCGCWAAGRSPLRCSHRRSGWGLIDLGIPEERGRQYEEDIKQGGVLAVVETSEDKVNDASSILRENGAKSVETHGGRDKSN